MITPKGFRYVVDALDVNVTTGPGVDGFSFVWDEGTGRFILTDIAAGAGHLLASGTVTGATSQAQVFTNGIDSGTSFTLNSIDYTESFETGFSVINLLPDSGRFAGTSNPNKRLAATFVTPEWIEPYNSSTAWTSAGEFIHNNTTFGGSAGALTQDVQDLLVAMGRTSGSTNRYGNEFFIAESTMGSGTAAAKSGKYLLAITSNELDSVFGLANKLSYSYWVRAKSGASIIISSRTTLADSFYVDGVDSSGVDVTLTEENNSDGWHHIAVQGYYRAFGYDNSMPYIYANDGTVVQMALPIFALGSVLIPQHVAPIPTINQTLWGDGTDYYLRDSSYSVGANIRTDTIRPDADATDAIKIQNAAGSATLINFDTTNERMRFGAPTATANSFVFGASASSTYAAEFQQEKTNLLLNVQNYTAASISNTTGFEFRLNTDVSGRSSFRFVGGFSDIVDATRTSYIAFYTNVSGTFAEAMRISGGKVGIGDTAPSNELVVVGTTETDNLIVDTIRPDSDATDAIKIQNAAGTASVLEFDTTSIALVSNRGTDSSNFLLSTAGNTSMTSTNVLAIGIGAAQSATSGVEWTAIGTRAARDSTTAKNYIAIGYEAARGAGGDNFFAAGWRAGFSCQGDGFFAFGYVAGYSNTTGENWQAIGYDAARFNITGDNFLAVGYQAARSHTGTEFTCMGYRSGYTATGDRGVFLGKQAGYTESADDRLHIANTTTKSLLLGDFANNNLAVGFADLSAPTARMDIAASTTTYASLRIRSGTAPTTPNDGDIWNDGTDFYLSDGTSDWSVGPTVRTTQIRPVADSTAAIIVQNAAGTEDVLTFDTANNEVMVNAKLGINISPTADTHLMIDGAAGTSNIMIIQGETDANGLNFFPTLNADGSTVTGMRVVPEVDLTATTGTVYGFNNSIRFVGTATATQVYCNFIQPDFRVGHSASATTTAGFHFANPLLSGSGTMTHYYAIRVQDITTPTNHKRALFLEVSSGASKYNIYASGTADNYFNGKVGIGDSTPSWELQVAGDTQLGGASDNNGFFGATPAAQPAHIVDADGTLADITTKFNTLLAQMATLGLQAAS